MLRRPHDAEIRWQRDSALRITVENYPQASVFAILH